jgi:hypothetical protein
MKLIPKNIVYLLLVSVHMLLLGCDTKIERSGYVVDDLTNKPLKDVSIEVYLKNQRKDSLTEKVFTNSEGYFQISEKRSKELLFELSKQGYISHVGTLSVLPDTIRLEPVKN